MAAIFPAGLMPWIERRFFDVTGKPLAAGWVYTFQAGTLTPLASYSDVNLTIANAVQMQLDSAGRLETSVYLLPQGYKFRVFDVNLALQYEQDNVEDIGEVFAANLGALLSAGSKSVASGYTVVGADRLVTVNSSGGPDPCQINLPPAASYTGVLTIKNLGTIRVAVNPNGSDAIDTLASSTQYVIPPATSPELPSIMLVSDGVSSWWILASHRTLVLTTRTTLTSAQIKALRATPIAIVPAPGAAGKIVRLISANAYFNYAGTNAFTNPQNLGIRYQNGAGALVSAAITGMGWLDQTASQFQPVALAAAGLIAAKPGIDNQPLVIHNEGASEITGNAAGDNTIVVQLTYAIDIVTWT